MKINLSYNLKKIINKFTVLKNSKYVFDSNFYLKNKNQDSIKSILFYFPSYEMMHFGDHLFFEPLARFLKFHGYSVVISPIEAMKFYFESLNFSIDNDNNLSDFDLIISRVEFFNDLKNTESQILFIDTTSSKIKLPLCDDMIEKVSRFLAIDYSGFDSIPSYFDSPSKLNLSFLDKNDRYIIFNNYIDSGSVRSSKLHQLALIKFVSDLKDKTGFKVIHTGTKSDKFNDLKEYGFVDIDLRGRTSIKDLFALCSLNNVIYNVSFDAFQMHLFLINKKKSFIFFRGRILKKNEDYIKNYVNPPFYCSNLENIIEYI